jgi:hypothetical protein
MSKIKEQMMQEEYDQAFQMIQTQLFEELVQTGSPNTEFPPLSPHALGGGGQMAGNNFSSPSTTKTTSSVASKPAILTLNAQARRNTTTKEKSLKAGPFIKPQFYWNEKKQALEEITMFEFNVL